MFNPAPDRITQGRNNTVYVWMKAQVLSPGMQNAYGSAAEKNKPSGDLSLPDNIYPGTDTAID